MHDTTIIKLLAHLLDYAASTNDLITSAHTTEILNCCNNDRVKAGLSMLQINTTLSNLALIKCKDMVDNNYFSHISPVHGSIFDMLHKQGIRYIYAGENLAIDRNAENAFREWMNSAAHRKNILFPSYRETGIGVFPKAKNSYVYTQLFIC